MKLISENFKNNDIMPKNQVYNGFGAGGNNLSPQLTWSDYPADTKSFAIVCHDPDAPKAHGWYHWFLINIPKDITSIKEGEKPAFGTELPTDFNVEGYGGAAPPPGHGKHRYNFTIHAMDTEKLDIKETVPYLIEREILKHSMDNSTITALYER